MKNFCYAALFLMIAGCQSTNTIYIVRHAEKSTEPAADPHLTAQGKQRAEALKEILKDKNIKAIYSTQTNRTVETATPLSKLINIPVRYYKNDSLLKFINSVINLKVNALIVGHSNTIPMMGEIFPPNKISRISDNEYDNLYTLKVKSGKVIDLSRTRYGQSSGPVK
jgi:phosphohistidine phosphatase SixA